jgi:hypothetical protein
MRGSMMRGTRAITRGVCGAARLLAAAALLVVGSGCADEACFSWTAQEGACPSQDEALQFFVPPGCFGGIESVDSDGEFIEAPDDQVPGDLCCYTVTESDNEYAFCDGGF